MTSTEEWRSIPGHPMYDVSDQGRVRSWFIGSWSTARRSEPRILRPRPIQSGHLQLRLDGRKSLLVHRLVALAFIGPPPFDGALVRHLDDDPLNNHPSNLAYGTKADNARDMVRNGGSRWANATACAQGHTYTEESTYVTRRGIRHCRICRARHERASRARRANRVEVAS